MGRLKGQKYKPLAYNGLDRVDNSRGYEPSNVVPCCRRCNRAKDDMSSQEFMKWLGQAYLTTHPEPFPD